MKIDYKKFLIFGLLFMIFEYLLMIIEIRPYANMLSKIQKYKINFFKNDKNEFILKNIFIYSFLYLFLYTFVIYYYIIEPNKNLLEGFIFGSFLCAIGDIFLFSCFDKAVYHYDILLYDIFVVGGFCVLISQYLFTNYYYILKNYIPLLFIIYLITMIWFFYECYKYNPDLSNINGIVLF